MQTQRTRVALTSMLANCVLLALSLDVYAVDWPMFGRDSTRNAVSPETDPPTQWDVKSGKNIRWTAALGTNTTGTPVVANGLVWVGTNNNDRRGRNKTEGDASVLSCFRESDGELLYSYVSPRLKERWTVDCPDSSMGSSPLVEGDRLWFVTNRFEVVCLDIKPLQKNAEEPRRIWTLDMIEKLGITPVGPYMGWTHRCSIAGYRDWIYVITGHGYDEWTRTPPAPRAPSLVCLEKRTGKVVWQNNTPGEHILYGQCASPLVIDIDGRPQCIAPQGDGWVRSFDALTGKPIWEFDLNAKSTRWQSTRGDRNNVLATPVLHEGRIYIANGRNTEQGEGPGRLVCLDPTGSGDISSELAVDAGGNPLPRRRVQAINEKQGERAIPNPKSGLVWEFASRTDDSVEQMHRAIASVAVAEGLVIAPDSSGFVHCLDAKNGKKHWTFDAFANVYATPLICDDKVFVADYDGDVTVLELDSELKELAEHNLGRSIYSSPIFSNGTLYIATMNRLHAVSANQGPSLAKKESGGYWPHWRGPHRNNKSDETGLLQEWPADGPRLIWRAEGIGEGICPVSVAGGRVYLISRHEDQEYLVGLDEVTGSHLWTQYLGRTIPQNRLMQWMTQRSPTVDDNRVYAVTGLGDLACLRTSDGKSLWRRNYEEHLNGKRGPWGFGDRPLIEKDELIVTPGGPDASVAALDKHTGKELWRCAVSDATRGNYGAGIVVDVAGTRQFAASFGKTIVGIDVVDGRLLWQTRTDINDRTNQLTPLAHESNVLFPFGYGQKCVALEIVPTGDRLQATSTNVMRIGFDPFHDSTFLVDNHLYVFGRIASCIDWKTGDAIWRKRVGSGRSFAATYADDRVYLRNTDGLVVLMHATPEDLTEKGRFTLPDGQRQAGATFPVVTGGRLYLRDNDRLFCYDVTAEPQESPPDPVTIALDPLKMRTAEADRQRLRTGIDRAPDAVFVATPQDVVEKMLELADVSKEDVVYDLGSGDGRIVITAAREYRAKAVGYEIDSELVQLSRGNIEQQKLGDLATIEHEDFFSVDLERADVVTVFLQPSVLKRLRPQFKKLRSGSRIVSHFFAIPGVKPDKTIQFESADDERHTLHLWTLPLKIDGDG